MWMRLLRRSSLENRPQRWIRLAATIAIIFFDRLRLLLGDEDAVAVVPFLAEVAADHEPGAVAGAANAVSEIFIFEDRRDFAFALGKVVEFLCNFFFLNREME